MPHHRHRFSGSFARWLVSSFALVGCGRLGYDAIERSAQDGAIALADASAMVRDASGYDGAVVLDDASVLGMVSSVDLGLRHTCAIRSSDGALACWGQGTDGKLGVGDALQRASPTVVTAPGIAWQAVSAGRSHTCAIAMDGQLHCWGTGTDGRLGTGDVSDRFVPVAVSASMPWVDVSAGGQHTCAIDASRRLHCWGQGLHGQLGIGAAGPEVRALVPTVVGSDSWADIACGLNFTCGLRTDGSIACFGSNQEGQLGNGTRDAVWTPTFLAGVWSAISVGDEFVCALAGDRLFCWGDNRAGQLGNGLSADGLGPREVTGGPWASVTAGVFHTCATRLDGSLLCWGANSDGQAGQTDLVDRHVPAALAETGWATVTGGGYHTCGALGSGELRCWGWGANGQLGNGGTSSSAEPVTVAPFGP